MNYRSPLKDRPLRNPGQSLDEQIDWEIQDRFLDYCFLAALFWILALIEWVAQYRHWPRNPGLFVAIAVIATAVTVIQFRRVRRRVKNLRQGRDGERAVGQFLERLREEGAQVFHDVPAESFNLDHVVISEKGIFVVETKTWTKRDSKSTIRAVDGVLYKNGYPVDPNPIQQVVGNARWLAQLLAESTGKTLPTFGVVVFPGWFVEPCDEKTKKIAWVLEPKALPAFIAEEPVRLVESDVKLAAFHLSRYIRTTPAE